MILYLKNTSLILATTLLLHILSAFPVHAVSKPPDITPGGLFYFKYQLPFEGAFLSLPMEDFEESPVADSAVIVFPEPLDSSTNIPGVFLPGDILDGLTLQTVEGAHPATALLVIGKDLVGKNWYQHHLPLFSSLYYDRVKNSDN